MGAVFKNECCHPEENYLFTMNIDGECCDVWVVQRPHQKFYKGHIEFCLRYGNQDHEYRSSWDCNWIERSIAYHNKFSYDYPGSVIARDQFIELKEKLKALDCWDADIDLSPEISELLYR